jgi:GNAT superfamily N-acetyltransferase
VTRPGTLADAEEAARLCAIVDQHGLFTARSLVHEMTTAPPRAHAAWWAAVEDGALVGWAGATRAFWSSAEGAAVLSLRVHPDLRGRGIGGELYAAADDHLRLIGAKRVTAWSHADEATRRFAARRGFEVSGGVTMSGVDPRTLGPLPNLGAETELLPFSAFEDDPEPIWRIDVEAGRDVPTDAPIDFDALGLEEWLEQMWRHPDHDLELGTVAVVDGEPAAMTAVLADRDTGRAITEMTGTLRAYRGRGLARLAKHRSLLRAAQAGITLALTGNHDANAPMLAINASLGYRPLEPALEWEQRR